jgi:hypothetical protein
MALQNIIKLFSETDNRDDLRSRLNKCNNTSELINCLELNHFSFTLDKFEESVNVLHV